jgi:hypothetical protein
MKHYLISNGILKLVDDDVTAELLVGSFGPFVRVTVVGEPLPWEFAARGAAVRSPMRRRYTLARSIEFVRDRLEARPPVETRPAIAPAVMAKLLNDPLAAAAHNPHARGYVVSYAGASTACPGCGRTHWIVGRVSAECAFCSTALPLAFQAAA